jgi:hypothetical protein
MMTMSDNIMKFLPAFLRVCSIALGLLTTPALAASCYISEFTGSGDAGTQIAKQPASVDQSPVAVSGASAQSAAFASSTRIIRVNCDVVVSFVTNPNPTATTSNARLPTGVVEYFQVVPGQKMAFITNN